ncbi:MAG TPA: hypothetical protein VHT30_00560 [Acidimicrobiales bacterium]|jgi:hypothetical protein|nr:hypothetical protein [Acidimicrobiales bacterium]
MHGRPNAIPGVLRLALPVMLVLAAACSRSSPAAHPAASATATATPTGRATPPASATPSQPAPTSSANGGRPSVLAAVTTSGKVQILDPTTGSVVRTLASGAALGDEVSLSRDGKTVYYQRASGCFDQIATVPVAGGPSTDVAAGSLPAISPDGTKLAYAHESHASMANPTACQGTDAGPGAYWMTVRNLATGTETKYPLGPDVIQNGLAPPIGHLSWAPDGKRVAVTIGAGQDNEEHNLILVDTTVDHYYLSASAVSVPVARSQPFYYGEAVYLPNGELFANVVCCPHGVTSTVLDEVHPTTGAVVEQVAVGVTTKPHGSLAADSTGTWLLYLSGNDLEVSLGGAKPAILAGGLVAAYA